MLRMTLIIQNWNQIFNLFFLMFRKEVSVFVGRYLFANTIASSSAHTWRDGCEMNNYNDINREIEKTCLFIHPV